MRQITLREYSTSDPLALSAAEIKGLRGVLDSHKLAIEPVVDMDGHFHLRPSSTIGAFQVAGMRVVIQPKLPISRVMFLASYALDAFNIREEDFPRLDDVPDLVQAMARLLRVSARRAFSRGLHRGYRSREEALTTIRGRILVDEQIRRRFNIPIPIEVRYDEYTEDITANRLVKAAATMLVQMRLRNHDDRAAMHHVLARLANVSLVEYSPRHVPEVRFNRLNERYREVVGLSRLVLQHASIDTQSGEADTPGFLMDMNQVFEKFVERALRKELRVSDGTLKGQHTTTLAKNGQIRLRPDLTLWQRRTRPGRSGRVCTFVGDAKYKRIDHSIPNADLYQLLAYATALDLPGGLLVYAQGAEGRTYRVRHADKRLEVFAFDLSGTRQQLMDRVGELAKSVRELRDEALEPRAADRKKNQAA